MYDMHTSFIRPCLISMTPRCMAMPHVHAACPCSMAMLREHAVWRSAWNAVWTSRYKNMNLKKWKLKWKQKIIMNKATDMEMDTDIDMETDMEKVTAMDKERTRTFFASFHFVSLRCLFVLLLNAAVSLRSKTNLSVLLRCATNLLVSFRSEKNFASV